MSRQSKSERLNKCRERLWALLESVDMSDGCKSYEGALEVGCEYNDFFASKGPLDPPVKWRITLHCYVLGSGRHHVFEGSTWEQAVSAFEKWLTTQEKTKGENQ